MESKEDETVRRRREGMVRIKEHLEKRHEIFAPSYESSNIYGSIFYWYYTISMTWITCKVTIPGVVYHGHDQWFYIILAMFFTIQSSVNWFMIWRWEMANYYKKGVSREVVNGVENEVQITKRCFSCQEDAPARSHHCKICNHCILKRDHHCFFTGCCIGFYNQRYFIVMLIYNICATTLGTIFLYLYMNRKYRVSSYEGLCNLPVVNMYCWFIGRFSLLDVYIAIQFWFSIVVFFGVSLFLWWELLMIFYKSTTYEFIKRIAKYSRCSYSNYFRSVFGNWYLLNLIWPLPIKPEGDGIHWPLGLKNN